MRKAHAVKMRRFGRSGTVDSSINPPRSSINSDGPDGPDGPHEPQGPHEPDGQGPDWVNAHEATKLLGIKKQTLYAYASRGLVRSTPGPDAGGKCRLYERAALERLKARSDARAGHGPVAAGALRWGEPVLETQVGTIDARGPIYRGKAAVDLVGDTFEEVCALLWNGAFTAPLDRGLGAPPSALRSLLRASSEPFDAMLLTAATFASLEPRGEGLKVTQQRAGSLVRRLIASCALPRGADAVAAALAADDCARALLIALGGRTTPPRVAAINEALVLSADHELNVSTFAARIASSSGATLSSAVVAALAALSGPLHGAATARVAAFVREVDRPEHAAEVVRVRLERGESIPGFGHPLYPEGDPRGAHLMRTARAISERDRAVRVLVSVSNAMHLVARAKPTLDVGLVALSSALGLPRGSPLAIFACGRLAGWIAHALEQREVGHLLRPRARYIGNA